MSSDGTGSSSSAPRSAYFVVLCRVLCNVPLYGLSPVVLSADKQAGLRSTSRTMNTSSVLDAARCLLCGQALAMQGPG